VRDSSASTRAAARATGAWERLAILWHRARHGLSVSATARAFVLSVQTIVNWNREVESGRARLVQARPPVNKLPDLVREIAHRLKGEWPRWGTRRIAGILARLGMKASRSTVQRALRERPPRPAGAGRVLPRRAGELAAKRPNHVWLVDFTRVGGLLRSPRSSDIRVVPVPTGTALRPQRRLPLADRRANMASDHIRVLLTAVHAPVGRFTHSVRDTSLRP
jgi:hypothetical protein